MELLIIQVNFVKNPPLKKIKLNKVPIQKNVHRSEICKTFRWRFFLEYLKPRKISDLYEVRVFPKLVQVQLLTKKFDFLK